MSGGVVVVVAAAIVAVALVLTFVLLHKPMRRARREANLELAQREFRLQRERLEALFFKLASSSGRPRGLRWTECDFENDVSYARDRATGELSAFVAVTIAFEAIEGGPMEDVEAVGNLRAATAVFTHKAQGWTTSGRAMFNLNPNEAIAFYEGLVEAAGGPGE